MPTHDELMRLESWRPKVIAHWRKLGAHALAETTASCPRGLFFDSDLLVIAALKARKGLSE